MADLEVEGAAPASGAPDSVAYHLLPALLLNELKRQHALIEGQQRLIAALAARLEGLEAASP